MNRHYFNLEQDVEQPRWSWDHFASHGIDLLTFGELNFQSFANLEPRTPGDFLLMPGNFLVRTRKFPWDPWEKLQK